MNFSSEFIDQIVAGVMRELNLPIPPKPVAAAPAVVATSDDAAAIQVHCNVVTEHLLSQLKAEGRLISLTSAAVITPSGRDYIRKNNVRISSGIGLGTTTPTTQGNPQAIRTTGRLIQIGAATAPATAAAIAGWCQVSAASESEALRTLATRNPSQVQLCCGGEPSVLACLLNRDRQVRAAVVSRTTDLKRLSETMSPHVYCVDGSGWSVVDFVQLMKSLRPANAAPSGWTEPQANAIHVGNSPMAGVHQ